MRVLPALRALLSARKFVAGVGAVALTVLLGVVAFALAAGSDEKAEVARAQAGLGAVPSGEEVPSLRTEHSRSYRQPDGSLKTKLGLEAVNYRAADGKWKPVDTTLRRTSAGVENTAGALKVRLPDRAEQSAVRVQRGDAWVSFALRGAKGASALSKNTARYANVLPGVSLKYEMGGSSVKETIVLASAKAPSSYTFDVKAADGLTPKVSPAGEIEFRDVTGRRQLTWAAPWMKDAAGQISRAVKYIVDPAAGGWTVRVVADQRWLQSKDRKFPVEIDPTTYFGVGKVCEIASGSLADTSNCTTSEMSVNVGRENGRVHRALVAFDESEIRSVIGDDALVTSADFFYYWTTSTPDTVELDVHQLTRSFTPAATWNTYDGTNGWTYGGGDGNPDRESRQTMHSDWVNGWVGLGVGRLVQGWLDGSIDNHGIGVIPADDAIDRIDNLDGLGLVIESRPKTGADPRATFEQIQPTATSKAKVNVANGNLVLTETDLTSGTGTSSIAVERTINSLGDLATSTFGSGWVPRYGAETTLWQHWVDRSYILEGPGGLAGRFHRKPDGTYDPPPGWNASLVENNDWTITVTFNDTGEAWDFDTSDPRRLTKITRGSYEIDLTYGNNGIVALADSDENEVTYIYDEQSGQLQSVGDGTTSRQYTLTDGKLLAIAPPNTPGVEYAYDTNGRVEQVTYPGGSRLTVAYDPSGRVTSLTQKPDDNPTNDLTTTFAYGSLSSPCLESDFSKTVVTYPNSQTRTYCSSRTGAMRASSPTISADVTPPTLTIGGPAWEQRGNWNASDELGLSVFAADTDSGITRVRTRLDAQDIEDHQQPCSIGACTATRSPSLNLTGVSSGSHTVDVAATDGATLQTARTWNIKVDRQDPTLELEGPLVDAEGDPLEPGDFALNLTANDDHSGVRSVEVLIDEQRHDYAEQDCPSGGCDLPLQAEIDADDLPPGSHTIEVRAEDHAGRLREESLDVLISSGTPAGYPTISLTGALAELDGDTVDGGEHSVTIEAAPGQGDGDRSLAEMSVAVDLDRVAAWEQTCTQACSMTRTFALDADRLDDGEHLIRVTAKDAEGRVSSKAVTLHVDREPPAAPEDLVAERIGSDVHLTWSPSAAQDVVGYEVLRDTPSGLQVVTAEPVPGRSWTDLQAPAGSSRYAIRAVDASDRTSTPTLAVTVPAAGNGPSAPTGLALRSVPEGIWITWRPAPGAHAYLIERADASTGPFERVDTVYSTTYSDTTPETGMPYYYRVRAVAEDGSASAASPAVVGTGFGSNQAADGLTLSLSGPLAAAAANETWISALEEELTVTAASDSGPADPAAIAEIRAQLNGQTAGEVQGPCAPAPCTLSGDLEIDLSQLEDGPHTLTVEAEDEDGQVATQHLDININRSAPTAPSGLVGERTSAGIRLDWDDSPDPDLSGYRVLRSTSGGDQWETLTADMLWEAGYTDADAPSGDAQYVVVSVDLAGQTATSDQLDMSLTTPPPTPTGLQATSGFREINLSWAPGTSAPDRYLVERRYDGGPWARLTVTPGASTSYEDTAVRPGTDYEYRLRAADSAGRVSAPSSSATSSADFGDTQPSVTLSGTLASQQGVWLTSGSYTVTATGADSGPLGPTPGIVSVQLLVDGEELELTEQPCPLGGCSLAASSSIDIGEVTEGTHEVEAVATDAVGQAATETIEFRVDHGPPAAPKGVETRDLSDSIGVTWESASESGLTYTVQRSTTRAGQYSTVASGITEPGFTDTSASASTRYWYRVAATDGASNTGPYSTAVEGKRSTAAGEAVTGVTATGGLAHIAVRWDASTADDLAGYYVYSGEDPDEPLARIGGLRKGGLYTDAEAEPGVRRYYEVRAVSESGKVGPVSMRVMAAADDLDAPTAPYEITYSRLEGGSGPILGSEASLPGSPTRSCMNDNDCVFGNVALAADSSRLAYGDETGGVRVDTTSGVSQLLCGPGSLLRPSPVACDGQPAEIPSPGLIYRTSYTEFTPDRQEIYFTHVVDDGSTAMAGAGIYRIDVGGGTPEVIFAATNEYSYVAPAVSADGRFLYAVRMQSAANGAFLGSEILRKDLTSGQTTVLDFDVDYPVAARPSPTGGRLIITAAVMSTGVELHLASVKRRQTERLTTLSTAILPSWSPDGRYILYDTMATGADQRNIVRWRLSTGETTTLGVVSTDSGLGHQTVAPTYPRAAAPTIDLPGDNGRLYSNGIAPKQITATAETEFDSIRAAGLVAGNETATTSVCQSSCPSSRDVSVTVPADEYDEGTYPIAGVAQSEAGTPARAVGALVIDRSKPTVEFSAHSTPAGDLLVDAQATEDPELADGTPGSGIAALEYRVKESGSWTAWQTLPEAGTMLSGAGGATDVRVRAIDRAGHSAASEEPVAPDRDPSDACWVGTELRPGTGFSHAVTSPETDVRVVGNYDVDCRKGVKTTKWKMIQRITVVETGEIIDPQTSRVVDSIGDDGKMVLDCVPGTRTYRYDVYGQAESTIAGRPVILGVRGSYPFRGGPFKLKCNEDGMWRVRAAKAARPNKALAAVLGSRPTGHEAHHIIPATLQGKGYKPVQALGYRCRIARHPDGWTDPNAVANGVWMEAKQHGRTHNGTNSAWLLKRLRPAYHGNDGYCNYRMARLVLADLKTKMSPGRSYPGKR